MLVVSLSQDTAPLHGAETNCVTVNQYETEMFGVHIKFMLTTTPIRNVIFPVQAAHFRTVQLITMTDVPEAWRTPQVVLVQASGWHGGLKCSEGMQ